MDFALGLASGLVAFTLFAFSILSGAGGISRVRWGLNLAGRVKTDPSLADKINALLRPSAPSAPASPPAAPKPTGEPLRLLAMLQGEARLIDFLLEDISGFEDAQIGQAVRDIHRKSQAVLKQHLVFAPIIPGNEGGTVTVPAGFDPSAIRILGNVTGNPPYTGELLHGGWKVKEIQLAPLPSGQDPFVLQPAEVQVP